MHLKLDIFQNLAVLLSLPIRPFPIPFFFFSTFRGISMTDNSKFVDFLIYDISCTSTHFCFLKDQSFSFKNSTLIFGLMILIKIIFLFSKIRYCIIYQKELVQLGYEWTIDKIDVVKQKKICPELYSFCQWPEKVFLWADFLFRISRFLLHWLLKILTLYFWEILIALIKIFYKFGDTFSVL